VTPPPTPSPTPCPLRPRYRPYPIKVVFGTPLEPRPDETVEALHARYCAALVKLGEQHNVEITIAE
jgi:hypothetical protein